MMTARTTKRREERGFAMLLVFVLAAGIAITLFIEVPRIAFESQRSREQMTIDRALQYQRAIQLFYRKYHLYPQTLDDLETTRNIRFLRHRYLDPLTGKDYRLLHVGPAGQLTDSLIQPPAPLPGSSPGSGPGSAQTPGQNSNSSQSNDPNNPNAQAPDPLNMAARRPSDRVIGAGGGAGGAAGAGGAPGDQPPPESDPNQPPQQPVQQPVDPNQPVQQPVDPNQPGQPGVPGQGGLPGQPVVVGQGGIGIPGQPGQPPTDPNQPGQPQDPSQQPQSPAQPGVSNPPPAPTSGFGLIPIPGQTPNPGQTPASNPAFPFPQTQFGPQAGAPGTPAAGGANAQGSQAANMIQQLLTTPRQPPSSTGGFTTGNTGGIAGVASTAEGKGIHIINDHAKYKEWEFVYDLKKDKTVVGAAGVAQQTQIQQQMQQPGALGAGGNNPFSSSSSGSSPSSTGPGSTIGPAPAPPNTPPPSQ
jgi:hypothetical protein